MDPTESRTKFSKLSRNHETPIIQTTKRLLGKHPAPQYQYNLIAVAYGGGSNVVSYGFNRPKTHPIQKEIADRHHITRMYPHSQSNWISYSQHAEVDCLKDVDASVECVVVYGETKSGKQIPTRPCNICQAFLEENDVEEVIFFDGESFVKEKVT